MAVTKDSGTVGGTAEKLAAARDAGASCIVVTVPPGGGAPFASGKWKTARFTGVRALGALIHRNLVVAYW